MKYSFKLVFIISVLFYFILFVSESLSAQQLKELKEKKKQIEKEIVIITSLITKTEKESSTSLANIKFTKRRIDLKNSLIKQIDSESEEVKRQIKGRKINIDSLSLRINVIKEEYRKIIVYSQRNSLKNSLLLQIFSAKDFNQAYKRIKFYQQVLGYKQQIVKQYKRSIEQIKEETDLLNESVNQLTKKQIEKEKEVKDLIKDELSYKEKIEILSKKKRQLSADLENQIQVSKKLNEEIRKVIEEEARRELENRNKSKSNSVNILALSSNFKENGGKFNLPVQDGIITGVYGESFHPVLKEVKVKNNGIDITISSNSIVYAIFKGEVRKIIRIPGSNLAILVRHGNYLSVYSNLSVVNVTVGQELNSYQKLGEINLQNGEETAILHFELWNENKTEDPLKWFKK